MKEVVFDIETYGDIRDKDALKITMVSLYDYASDAFVSFDEHHLSELWPYLEKAERLIGYNSKFFDLPILQKHYTGNLSLIPHLDILEKIKESSGKRFKLDDIAKATLENVAKGGDGLLAQKWYEEGDIEKIKKYCEQDVLVTREVYEFGKKNKMLYYPAITGEVFPIGVNFDFEKSATMGAQGQGTGINLTLPF